MSTLDDVTDEHGTDDVPLSQTQPRHPLVAREGRPVQPRWVETLRRFSCAVLNRARRRRQEVSSGD